MTKISTVLIVVFLTRQLKFLNCLKTFKLLQTKSLTLASELLSLGIIGIIGIFKQTFCQQRHRLHRQMDGKKKRKVQGVTETFWILCGYPQNCYLISHQTYTCLSLRIQDADVIIDKSSQKKKQQHAFDERGLSSRYSSVFFFFFFFFFFICS